MMITGILCGVILPVISRIIDDVNRNQTQPPAPPPSLSVLTQQQQQEQQATSVSELPKKDVRILLHGIRRSVLQGVTILFSGVFTLDTEPSEQPLWQLAISFGATCTTERTINVTHCVCNTIGTTKYTWAKKHNIMTVKPGWLECSAALWKRADEVQFKI